MTSGKHRKPQRLLSQPAEAWAEQDAHAQSLGQSWAEWARRALAEMMKRQKKSLDVRQ